MRPSRILSALFLLAASAGAQASLVYTFDSGAQGWTGAGGSPAFSWHATGGVGNTGYIQAVDIAGGQMMVISPALGDQSSLLGGLLSFDYNVFGLQSGNTYVPNAPFGSVTISSNGHFVTADLVPNIPVAGDISGTGWHGASLALSDLNWSGNASLSSVLANVTKISILTEYDLTQRFPDEIVGIDNFALTAAAVPEPEIAALLLLGATGLFAARRRTRRSR